MVEKQMFERCVAAEALRQAVAGREDEYPIVTETINLLDNQVACRGDRYCVNNTDGHCTKRVSQMLSALAFNDKRAQRASRENS